MRNQAFFLMTASLARLTCNLTVISTSDHELHLQVGPCFQEVFFIVMGAKFICFCFCRVLFLSSSQSLLLLLFVVVFAFVVDNVLQRKQCSIILEINVSCNSNNEVVGISMICDSYNTGYCHNHIDVCIRVNVDNCIHGNKYQFTC